MHMDCISFNSVYNLVSAMEDLCLRITLVAGMILKNLDNQSLMIYKESSRGIHQYLTEEKLVSIRIIKEHKKSFVQFQNVWKKVLKKASVETVQEFATLVREFFNPRFPTDDIYDGRHKRRENQCLYTFTVTHLGLAYGVILFTGMCSCHMQV